MQNSRKTAGLFDRIFIRTCDHTRVFAEILVKQYWLGQLGPFKNFSITNLGRQVKRKKNQKEHKAKTNNVGRKFDTVGQALTMCKMSINDKIL